MDSGADHATTRSLGLREITRRTAGLIAPVVLSFFASTAILIFVGLALHVSADLARWNLFVFVSLLFTGFSVWVSQRAESAAEFRYSLATLLLSFGAIVSFGARTANAGFALADGQHALKANSIVGLFLQTTAAAKGDLIFTIVVAGLALVTCSICALSAYAMRSNSTKSERREPNLFPAAVTLLVCDALFQEWVQPRATSFAPPDLIWLVPLFLSYVFLIGLFLFMSESTRALALEASRLLASQATERVIPLAQLVWRSLLGAVLGIVIALAAAGAVVAIIGVFPIFAGGLTEIPHVLAVALYYASQVAPAIAFALAGALLFFVFALTIFVWPLALVSALSEIPLRGWRLRLEGMLKTLRKPIEAFGFQLSLTLLILSLVAFVASLTSWQVSYDQIGAYVRSVASVRLIALDEIVARSGFFVVAIVFSISAAASALVAGWLVAVAAVGLLGHALKWLGLKIVEAPGWVGRICGYLLSAFDQACDLALWMIRPLWRLVVRLAFGASILLASGPVIALFVGVLNSIAHAPKQSVAPEARPQQMISFEAPSWLLPAILTSLTVALGALALFYLRHIIARAWQALRRPLLASIQIVLIAVLIAAAAAAAPQAYAALLFGFTHVSLQWAHVDINPALSTAAGALSALPPLAARILIVLAIAAGATLLLYGACASALLALAVAGEGVKSVGVRLIPWGARVGDDLGGVLARMTGGVASTATQTLQSIANKRWLELMTKVGAGLVFAALVALIFVGVRFFIDAHPPNVALLGAYATRFVEAIVAVSAVALLTWASWRWRDAIIRALPRITVLVVVLLAILFYRPPSPAIGACGRIICDPQPPPPPTALAAVRDDQTHWRFSSAREIGRGTSNYGPLETRLAIDTRNLCNANIVIVIGAASGDGDSGFNHRLAECRGLALAQVLSQRMSQCAPIRARTLWIVNLGAHQSGAVSAIDRSPWVLSITGLDPNAPAQAISGVLSNQGDRLRRLLNDRRFSDYEPPEWRHWLFDPASQTQQSNELAACAPLMRPRTRAISSAGNAG